MFCIDYLSDWENLNQEEYKIKKDKITKTFFKRLERLIPGINKEIDFYEVGTFKTIARYALNTKGTPYGYAQIPKQSEMFRIPNKTPIKNLFLASAWTNSGRGFTGAILSGWFCATEILNKKN